MKQFLLDHSNCLNGGDDCRAVMKESIAGAFVYHSDYNTLLAERDRYLTALQKIDTGSRLDCICEKHQDYEGDYQPEHCPYCIAATALKGGE